MRYKVPKPLYIGSGFAGCVGALYLLKDYMGGLRYTHNEKLTGKVVIVTGANTGIGKETARVLAARDAKVVMACRNMAKCEEARRDIVLDTKNKYVYCRQCDLASQESIRKFVNRFKKENSKLHILINNGAVMRCPQDYTKEGIELQLGVNHMGHFLLTNLLLDILKDSAPSRIVNLASAAYLRGKINVKDFNSSEKYDPVKAYNQSKLAIVLFTRELAKRLAGTGVTVNAVHPGIVDTNLTRHMSFYSSWLSSIFVKPFVWPFIKTSKRGAQTVLQAALDPELNSVTGCYFVEGQPVEVSEEAMNDKLAKWLWLTSEKWTKLNSHPNVQQAQTQ